jgi:hypothetical protein
VTSTLIFDIEIYRDYFDVAFLNADTGVVRHFELYDGHPFNADVVRAIVEKNLLVTFNGNNFDVPLLSLALGGAKLPQLKSTADKIIKQNMKHWTLGIELIPCDHIDLFEVAPGMASLKIYGGRMHAPKMQDLPFHPDDGIEAGQRAVLREYCGNDLRTTLALYEKLKPQIELRAKMSEQYGIDLRSKSDAQIAEAVIKSEVERLLKRKLPKLDPFGRAGDSFRYTPPAFIEFTSEPMKVALAEVLAAEFVIAANGTVTMPKGLASLKIKIGGSTYRMGMGGIHSSEKSVAHFTDDDFFLVDRDVASYYPAIILNCGLAPESMGRQFTKVYSSIVARRLAAKRIGDTVTADALKITINGSFGKFGSPYSSLYAPTLLIQTTVTGQLALLMLIEMLESEGIPVVSANTDGIVIKCPRACAPMMEFIIWEWESRTGFVTEASYYKAIYSRDVNNYVAIKPDGKYKAKGAYAPVGLQKSPANEISILAAVKFLMDGTPVEDTIAGCRDITKFITVRTVKGGAMKGDVLLGKAVRWYYAAGETGAITYKLNGYTVPRSEGARPLMDLPATFPDNVDHTWYVGEAFAILDEIGADRWSVNATTGAMT